MEEKEKKGKFNWFPGHMKNALKDIESSKIKIADAILYVLDSRAPYSCENPNIKKITHGKPVVYLFNKIDLADEERIAEIQKEFANQGKVSVVSNAKDINCKFEIKNAIKRVLREKIERNREKGVSATYKILVLGVPNTGKSAIINLLSGERKTKASNTPGVTRFNQWIKIDDNFMLCDTPGVLWPKFDEIISKNLAYIGCLSDKEFDLSDLGYELMETVCEKYPKNLEEKFDIDLNDDFEVFLEIYNIFCIKRGFIMRGNEIDYERAGRAFIDDFRSGKLGKITLE